MDSLRATHLVRTGKLRTQSASRRFAHSTIFLRLSRLKVGL